ncbi:MAG TPA: TetR family transcriptional regulator [Bdellovibrionales bacterium]|nr:TetR family transcriptional regulator [Bdellovibrionales bacterium]
MRKSELTKQSLFRTAVEMIAREGFEATTMRAVAAKAGVAPGAIYYYFESKESLIQEYYRQSHADHIKALEGFLETETSFEKRLHRVVTSKIEVALPYKNMARALFRIAGDPASRLSPFSDESRDLRLEAVKLFEEVVRGSDSKFHAELAPMLPKYLWLYMMGVILFWIYDKSESSKNTFSFIDKTVPLIASLNDTIMSPLAAPFRKKIISLLKSFEPDLGEKAGA